MFSTSSTDYSYLHPTSQKTIEINNGQKMNKYNSLVTKQYFTNKLPCSLVVIIRLYNFDLIILNNIQFIKTLKSNLQTTRITFL